MQAQDNGIRPRNRIKLALSIYGDVSADWLIHWMTFQAQIAGYKGYKGMVLTRGSCYVHMNSNLLASAALNDTDWDYLLHIQQDQIMPEGLLERVGSYTDPIVGVMTFGRAMEQPQAVPGRFNGEGEFHRLTDEEAEQLMDEPGLHPISAVGLGCTAIRRDVFDEWNSAIGPWFQVPTTAGYSWGEDVWFCRMAAEQGWQTYVDTTLVSGHIGTWISREDTFRARLAHDRRQEWLEAPAAV